MIIPRDEAIANVLAACDGYFGSVAEPQQLSPLQKRPPWFQALAIHIEDWKSRPKVTRSPREECPKRPKNGYCAGSRKAPVHGSIENYTYDYPYNGLRGYSKGLCIECGRTLRLQPDGQLIALHGALPEGRRLDFASPMDFACPTCKVAVRERCLASTGTRTATAHAARKALRKG